MVTVTVMIPKFFCRLLNMEQKCNIATRELDELQEEINKHVEEAERNYDNLRVRRTIIAYNECVYLQCIYMYMYIYMFRQ